MVLLWKLTTVFLFDLVGKEKQNDNKFQEKEGMKLKKGETSWEFLWEFRDIFTE